MLTSTRSTSRSQSSPAGYLENEVLQHIIRERYADGDSKAVVTLFVFALGQVAVEGSSGAALGPVHSKPSGIRGGTAVRRPGLELFNEGSRRMGLMLLSRDFDPHRRSSPAFHVQVGLRWKC